MLALAAAGACAPVDVVRGSEARMPGTRETRIAEPVFGREAVLYEAGLGRERSIVLVHGLGSNAAQDFAGVVQWMSRDFHVVTFDLPGFGASSKQNAAYTPANYVTFVKYVAAHHVRRPFVLVGHSMGALIALRYAATHPDDVQRLVVADVPGVLHRLSYMSRLASGGAAALLPGIPLPAERIEALARRLLGLAARAPVDLAETVADPELRMRYLEGLPER
ncbi:MAG: alpha/beta hydrolase, partial [Proteobacteria bacterium]|nr:alpha/beta hydrolase [Pseudomonadota bacterium]